MEPKQPLLPEEITGRFLRSLRNQFYKGQDKFFYQEKALLLQAISYPARWLDDRAVAINSDRYTVILTEIIRTINAHGNLREIRSPGRYLLHAVQEHMRHQGETYYDAGKATRNAIEDAIAGLKSRTGKKAVAIDSTVAVLAETHRVLSSAKKLAKKKSTEAPGQRSLF